MTSRQLLDRIKERFEDFFDPHNPVHKTLADLHEVAEMHEAQLQELSPPPERARSDGQ